MKCTSCLVHKTGSDPYWNRRGFRQRSLVQIFCHIQIFQPLDRNFLRLASISVKWRKSPSDFQLLRHCYYRLPGASPAGRQCPPIFVFAPPPFFFLPPHGIFWEEEVAFFGRKSVKICDFGQKKPSDFGEDLFFLDWSENY